MAKFKVGDRVMMKFNTGRITRIVWNEFGYKSAEPAVVAAVDNGDIYFKYRVLLDNKDPTDCGYWWAAESELSPLLPAIPAGWTPADEPKHDCNHVHVLLSSGREWYGWYSPGIAWKVFLDNADPSAIKRDIGADHGMTRDAAPGEVIAWREIEPADEPAAQVRYAVRYSNTVKDKDDDGDYYLTMDEAAVEAKRLVAKYGKEIEVGHWVVDAVVKPAEPEVIRMEE